MVIRELLTVWGFDIDDKPLKELESSIDTVNRAIKVTAAVGITAAASLFGLAKTASSAGDGIAKTADKIGFSTDALQELRYAAENATDLGINSIDMALQRFSRRASEAAKGTGEAKGALEELNIQLVDNEGNIRAADDLLMDVADSLQSVTSEQDRLRLAFKLFDSEGAGFVNLLKEGRDGVIALRKEARDLGGVISEADIRASEAFEDSLLRMTTTIKGVSLAIGAGLMPEIMEVIDQVTAWVKANRELINQRMSTILNTLRLTVSATADVLGYMLTGISHVVSALGGLDNVARLVGIALLYMASVSVIAGLSALVGAVIAVAKAVRSVGLAAIFTHKAFKRTILGALLTGLILFLDDMNEWVKGGKSLLGEWLGPWEDAKASILGVFEAIGDGYDWLMRKLSDGLDEVAAVFDGIVEGIQSILDWRNQLLGALSSGFGSLPSVSDLLDSLPETFDIMGRMMSPAPAVTPLPATSPLGAPVAPTQNINANVTVNARPGMSSDEVSLIRQQAEAGVNDSLARAATRLSSNQPGYLYNGRD
jgi:TP901 family phage tail tape measure protein